MTRLSLSGTWWRLIPPPIGDLVIFFACLRASLALRQAALLTPHTLSVFAPLFIGWLVLFYVVGLYDLRQVRSFPDLIGNLFASSLLCAGAGVTYFYALLPYLQLSPKTHLAIIVVASHILVFAWRRVWLALIDFKLLDQRIVFLGEDLYVAEIENAIKVNQDTGFLPVQWASPTVDLVVADSEWVEANWDRAKAVFLSAVTNGVPIVPLESFYESVFGKVSPHHAGRPSWALSHVLPHTGSLYRRLKRLIDLVGSAFLIAALSPVMAVVALAILIVDGKPIFYGQKRLGFLGRPFTVLKFRTMAVSADAHGPFYVGAPDQKDSRLTRLGGFLRRYRLDELPQLVNVLTGRMSLVGPRPEWVKEIAVLEKTVPNYHLRHLVMPGVTGWAQVYFRATNNPNDSLEKLHYDLYYVKNVSLALDFAILLKTLKRVFVKDTRIAAQPMPKLRALPEKHTNWAGEALSQAGR